MATASLFISSVQKEMQEERRAVKAFVEGDPLLRRYFTAFLFEDLPASDRRADEVYLDEVDHCAVYIGLFGQEYGFEDGNGVSPTEREFDRATTKGKPRLIFVKGTDDRARHPKMRALIRKAGEQLIWRRFGSVPELTAALCASLVEHLERKGLLRTRPFDASACPQATLSDISEEKVQWFLARARGERRYALAEKTPKAEVLAHLNLLDAGQPTHAAVLLFGRDPQRFLLTSEVKCLHFHGTEVRKPAPAKEGDVGSKTTCQLSQKGQDAFFLMIPGFSYGLSLFQKFIMRAANPNNSCSSQLATKGNEGDVGSKTT